MLAYRRSGFIALSLVVAFAAAASDALAADPVPVRLADINPGKPASLPRIFFDLNGTLLFVATDAPGKVGVWRSDGTPAGTTKLSDGSTTGFGKLGGLAYFGQGDNCRELKKTDGMSIGGTLAVTSTCPSTSHTWFETLTLAGKLFFLVNAPGSGTELWSSDGTAANTKIVQDAVVGPQTFVPEPPAMAMLGGDKIVYVAADDQPWVTDGTTATALGTSLPAGRINGMVSAGANVFFYKQTAASGTVLYRTNGTAAGTIAVGYFANGLLLPGANGSTVFFSGHAQNTGGDSELWKTDGEMAVRVKDIEAGTGSSTPRDFTAVGPITFFSATTIANGKELWKTDGSEAGTVLVKDIAPGAASAGVDGLANINGVLYFIANDGVHGYEVWKSDGTDAGTVMVADGVPGAEGLVDPTKVPARFALAGTHVFFVGDDGASGAELYALDAPAAKPNDLPDGGGASSSSSSSSSSGGGGDAGAGAPPNSASGDDSGCGCRTTKSTSSFSALTILAAIAIALRRRRNT